MGRGHGGVDSYTLTRDCLMSRYVIRQSSGPERGDLRVNSPMNAGIVGSQSDPGHPVTAPHLQSHE